MSHRLLGSARNDRRGRAGACQTRPRRDLSRGQRAAGSRLSAEPAYRHRRARPAITTRCRPGASAVDARSEAFYLSAAAHVVLVLQSLPSRPLSLCSPGPRDAVDMKGEEDAEYPPELELPRWAAEPKRTSRTLTFLRACAFILTGLVVGILVRDLGVTQGAVKPWVSSKLPLQFNGAAPAEAQHPLVEVLLPGGAGVRPDSHGARFNVSVCALATNEARFLPEWITYHRMGESRLRRPRDDACSEGVRGQPESSGSTCTTRTTIRRRPKHCYRSSRTAASCCITCSGQNVRLRPRSRSRRRD